VIGEGGGGGGIEVLASALPVVIQREPRVDVAVERFGEVGLRAKIEAVFVALRGELLCPFEDARIADIDEISALPCESFLRADGEGVPGEEVAAGAAVGVPLEIIASEEGDVPQLRGVVEDAGSGVEAVEIQRGEAVVAEEALAEDGLEGEVVREFDFVAQADLAEKIAVGLFVVA